MQGHGLMSFPVPLEQSPCWPSWPHQVLKADGTNKLRWQGIGMLSCALVHLDNNGSGTK